MWLFVSISFSGDLIFKLLVGGNNAVVFGRSGCAAGSALAPALTSPFAPANLLMKSSIKLTKSGIIIRPICLSVGSAGCGYFEAKYSTVYT